MQVIMPEHRKIWMSVTKIELDAMAAHAKAEWPKEACGMLLDTGYMPCANVAQNPLTDFALADKLYLQFKDRLRAIFHSHPGRTDEGGKYTHGAKYPSKMDMERQEAIQVPWLLAAMNRGVVIELFEFGCHLPASPYIGRVFRPGVHDCYALVRDYYNQDLGIALPYWPRNAGWWSIGETVISDGIKAMGFFEIKDMNDVLAFDCATGRIGGQIDNHCGVILKDGMLLHHQAGMLSVKEPAARYVRGVNARFWRHPVIAQRYASGEYET